VISHDRKLLRLAFIALVASSSALPANIVKIDEFGHGTQDRFPQNPKLDFNQGVNDPFSNKKTLVYRLPFGVANGDVFVFEPGSSTATDLLRFENGKDLFVFSDSEIINERPPGLADVGVPASSQPNAPQTSALETGTEDNNAVTYTPGSGQPGYPGFALTYQFQSDGSSIPEPGGWPLVALALSGLLLTLKRRQNKRLLSRVGLRIKRLMKAGAARPNLLLPLIVLMTITFTPKAGGQAARFTTPRVSSAEDVSASPTQDPASAFSDPEWSRKRGQRPIEDFISAQGTTSVFYQGPFAPGLPDYAVGFTTANCPGEFCQYPTSRIVVVDYAGGANKYLKKHGYGSLETKTDGSITERLLPDRRAEVTVVLHTTNALTFVSTWDYSLPSPPESAETNTRLFGSSVQDLFRDPSSRPALGNSDLVMIFKNPRLGAPMPDLVKLFAFGAYPNIELTSVYLSVDAAGPLPDGTQAHCTVLQHYVNPPPLLINGVLTTPSLLDGGWISEFVDIK
jgi:hypothetical protein